MTEIEMAMSREPSERLDVLDVLIGNWINKGYTVGTDGSRGEEILTSDVYAWGPGRQFVVHTAYGRIGDVDVGGIEIITYDSERDVFRSHFFDSQGNITVDELTVEGGIWEWVGERTRCRAVFSAGGTKQEAHHEMRDGDRWVPAMEVTLVKVA